MKKVSKGIQRLTQRAAELRLVVEAAPAKAAELREAVTAAAGQVQHLRTELVSGVAALRPGADADGLAQLREIDASADVLAEAGYHLGGVDLDLAAGKKLRVRLERIEEIDTARIRALFASNVHRPVIKVLLAAILHATDLAGKVALTRLEFRELIVDMSTGHAVRIGWRGEEDEPAEATVPGASPATPSSSGAEVRPPTFSQSSFFERTPVAPTPTSATGAAQVVATSPVPPANPPARANEPVRVATPASRASALDRFKKMPDLTKRSAG